MKLIKVKGWTFVKNGATSYWFEETTDGSGDTIGPEELLEIGCQLEAENEALRERDKTMSKLLIEIYDMIELRIPKHDTLLTEKETP